MNTQHEETPTMETCYNQDKNPARADDGSDGLLCQSCARQGHTCCQGHDIYVTRGDCERIEQQVRRNDFFEYRRCSDAAYAEQGQDPFWEKNVFRADGTRRVLKWRTDRDCVFLSSDGCVLSMSARPLICRLYPHLYTAAGISGQWDPDCPATVNKPSWVVTRGIAGTTDEQAITWHQMLYREIQREELDQ